MSVVGKCPSLEGVRHRQMVVLGRWSLYAGGRWLTWKMSVVGKCPSLEGVRHRQMVVLGRWSLYAC